MGLFKRKQEPLDAAYLALTSQIKQLQHQSDRQEQSLRLLEKESEKGRLEFQKHTMSVEDMLDILQEKE